MVKGVDISHWQGVLNFAQLMAAGDLFCIAKATDGVGMKDAMFDRNRIAAKAAGMIFGSYHWFHPSQSVEEQINHYIAVAGKRLPGELPPAIDFEQTTDTNAVGVATTKARLLQLLNGIQKIDGVAPMLYFSPGWVDKYGDLSAFAHFPMWVANYGVNHPRIHAPWKTFTIWQYAEDHGLDKDQFNGDVAQLKAFAGVHNA